MLPNPIFIIGTERSGSNLLRLLLNAHSRIAIPHPPHLMRDLAPVAKKYGDLSNDRNFRALARDVARLVNLHFAPWPFRIESNLLLETADHRSLYGLYDALYTLNRKHEGKPRWGCKSTFMYQQIDTILRHHDEPKFLHLVRDPRDVAASAGESIFSNYHPYKEAELWAKQQYEIERHRANLGERRLLRIRYEDLTTDAEKEMRRLMSFLDESFEPKQLAFFQGREARQLSKLSQSWRNCAKPAASHRVGRFRAALSERDLGWVEFHAGDLMQRYGYSPSRQERPEAPTRAELARIEASERWRRLRAETRALFYDRNFSIRWKKWFYLNYVRTRRSFTYG